MDKQIIKDNAEAIVNFMVHGTPEYVRAYNKIDRGIDKFCDKWDRWSEEKQQEFGEGCDWDYIFDMVGCMPTYFSTVLGLDDMMDEKEYAEITHKDIAWAEAANVLCARRGTIYLPAAENPLISYMGNEMCGCGNGCCIEESLRYDDKFLDKFIEIYDLERKFDSGELFFVGGRLFSGGRSMTNMKSIKKAVKKLGEKVRIIEKKGDEVIPHDIVEGGKVTAEVVSLSEVGFNILAIGPSCESYSSILVEDDGKCDSNVNADIVEAFIQKFGYAA